MKKKILRIIAASAFVAIAIYNGKIISNSSSNKIILENLIGISVAEAETGSGSGCSATQACPDSSSGRPLATDYDPETGISQCCKMEDNNRGCYGPYA